MQQIAATSTDASPPVWYGWLAEVAASQQEGYARKVASEAASVGGTTPLSRPLFRWERFRQGPKHCTPAPMPAISSAPSVDGGTGRLDRSIHARGPAPRRASDRQHPCRVALQAHAGYKWSARCVYSGVVLSMSVGIGCRMRPASHRCCHKRFAAPLIASAAWGDTPDTQGSGSSTALQRRRSVGLLTASDER